MKFTGPLAMVLKVFDVLKWMQEEAKDKSIL